MGASRSLYQLSGDSNLLGGPSDTAFKNIGHAKPSPYVGKIDWLAAKSEGRVAGNDKERSETREPGDDVLRNAVAEVRLLGVAADVVERKNGDGGLVGQGQWCIGHRRGRFLGPAPDAHWLRDVLQPLLAKVIEGEVRLSRELLLDRIGYADPSRLRYRLIAVPRC